MRVGSLKREGQAALWAVESARAAHDDVLEVGWLAAGEGGLEGLVGGGIHQAYRILQYCFGVGGGAVGVPLLIAVGLMRRNGYERLIEGALEASLKRFSDAWMVRDVEAVGCRLQA